MNKELINKLASVVNALNSIEVKGKQNLMNLGGCIAVVEEVCQQLMSEHTEQDSDTDAKD